MTEAKKRTPKTPKQRAEEQLAVCERKIKRVTDKAEQLEAEARELRRSELLPLQRERDYLADSPYLREPQPVAEDDGQTVTVHGKPVTDDTE